MANLKELRNRISSVASTQKITRAMQMVAASKLRKAQDAVESTSILINYFKLLVTYQGKWKVMIMHQNFW